MADMKITRADILRMSVAERIELLGEIWDSLEGPSEHPQLTEAEKKELDRRLEEYERDPRAFKSWEQVR
jgi:putative addiction module component (TIGR02574 family)